MTVLALEIGSSGFAAGQVADNVGADAIRRIPLPSTEPWNGCRDLLLEVAAGTEVTAVGIACSGPIDMAAGVVACAQIPQWRAGFLLVEAVQKLFPTAAVRVALDGVCLALAERTLGDAHDVMDALAISISDHISGGVILGGCAVVGRTGNAGSVAHMLVPGFDERCECGGRGCVDAVASGRAIRSWARDRGWAGDSLAALLTAAQSGDEITAAALGRAGIALGKAISSTAALLDLDLVVISGSVATVGAPLWRPLGEAVAGHARPGYLAGLRIIPSKIDGLGALAGAGILALMGNK
ncbi:ROK family protein [Nocardia jejuensis]|uniref:ROK family protein n=1 Tax=Nocardia jejuensis TaxID=328049 RepID=UPI00082F65C9|nr:ROK family protein [Nocardia jejuensis]